jgi:hypothetical protein
MHAFPEFMKHPANRIAATDQATPGVEGTHSMEPMAAR